MPPTTRLLLTRYEAKNESNEYHGKGVDRTVPHVWQRIEPIQATKNNKQTNILFFLSTHTTLHHTGTV